MAMVPPSTESCEQTPPTRGTIVIDYLREDKAFRDVVFVVQWRRFPVHRAVIASASPVIKAMLTNGMKETTQKKIVLKEVTADVWQVVLDYYYNAPLDLKGITFAMKVLECARRYQFEHLESTISDFVSSKLHVENCVDILIVARQLHATRLHDATLNFVKRVFGRLIPSSLFSDTADGDEVCTLTKLDFVDLYAICSADDLIVHGEIDIVCAIVLWISAKGKDLEAVSQGKTAPMTIIAEESKTSIVGKLLQCIDWRNLSEHDLKIAARLCARLSLPNVRDVCLEFLVRTNYPKVTPLIREKRPPYPRRAPSFTWMWRVYNVGMFGEPNKKNIYYRDFKLVSPEFADDLGKCKWYLQVHTWSDGIGGNNYLFVNLRLKSLLSADPTETVDYRCFATSDEHFIPKDLTSGWNSEQIISKLDFHYNSFGLGETDTVLQKMCERKSSSILFGVSIWFLGKENKN